MRSLYDGLDAAKQTDRFLRGLLRGASSQDGEFSHFATSATLKQAGRSLPDSPDPDMKGCRIDLRKEAGSQ